MDSQVAVLPPFDVMTLLSPSVPFNELIATITCLNVLSPAKNVLEFLSLAALVLRRSRGTFPDDRLSAFNVFNPDPLPVNVPLAVIFSPTKSFLAIPTPPATLKAPLVKPLASRVEVIFVYPSPVVRISMSSSRLSPVAITNFVFSPDSA